MLLPFTTRLTRTHRFDPEMAAFADRHYSRRKKGAKQYAGNGSDICLRNNDATILFVWLLQQFRRDGQQGFNCSKFRNETRQLSSTLILEAEQYVVKTWGPGRAYTYIDPKEVKSPNPGYCFKRAGWKFVGYSSTGKHILEKHLQLGGDMKRQDSPAVASQKFGRVAVKPLYIENLYETLRQGKDLVESAFVHVSHGGPTRADAEAWLAKAKEALQEPDSVCEGCISDGKKPHDHSERSQ